MKLIHFGKIENGKIVLDVPALLNRNLSRIKNGTRVQIVIENESKCITQEQRGFLYANIYKLMVPKHFESISEADTYFKTEYKKYNNITIDISKEDFDRKEYSEYIDFCCREAAKMGFCVPEPDFRR